MKIDEICTYAPKSDIKAGAATQDGQYMFFTSSEDETKRYSDYQFDGEGIIMGTGGNATLHYYNGKYAVSTDCIVLFPDNRVKCKYLYYFFLANMHILESGFKGAGLKHTSKKYIGNIDVKHIPSIEIQAQVIEILDKIFMTIWLQKRQLLVLDKLIKARFVELFFDKGYPVLGWNDVFNTTTGKLDSNAMVENGEYPFFTCAKDVFRIDKYAFDQEALLLAGNNAAGKYDVKYYKGKFNAYQRTYVLGLKQDWSYRLFQYQLEDKLVYLQHQSLGGLTKYLTMKILGDLSFIVPPVEQQVEFEKFVAQVDKSKTVLQNSLDESQLLFDSLLQKYFE